MATGEQDTEGFILNKSTDKEARLTLFYWTICHPSWRKPSIISLCLSQVKVTVEVAWTYRCLSKKQANRISDVNVMSSMWFSGNIRNALVSMIEIFSFRQTWYEENDSEFSVGICLRIQAQFFSRSSVLFERMWYNEWKSSSTNDDGLSISVDKLGYCCVQEKEIKQV